jgi:hypothetical protein
LKPSNKLYLTLIYPRSYYKEIRNLAFVKVFVQKK